MADMPRNTAADLVHLLNYKGQGDYIGEPISQLAHSLQCAHLASSNGADEETTIAALLHDIGVFSNGIKPISLSSFPKANFSQSAKSSR